MPAELSLSDDEGNVLKAKTLWEIIPVGHRIGMRERLFTELEDKDVKSLRNEFAGSQADRADRIVKVEAEAKKITDKLKTTNISDKSGKKECPAKFAAEAKKPKATAEQEITISRLDIRVGVKSCTLKCFLMKKFRGGSFSPLFHGLIWAMFYF